MTVAIMQPYLFPYPGYFHLVHAADAFVVYGEAQYRRGGYVNRNKISIGGADQWFTLPVERGQLRDTIDRREVSPRSVARWRERFLRSFGQAYAKTDYRDAALALVVQVLAPAHAQPIGPTAAASVRAVAKYLGLLGETRVLDSGELDYDRHGTAQEKVIGMCRALGATRYVNAAGGRELYDADAFAAEGIALRFVGDGATLPPPYRPDLSIVDALCKFDPTTLRDVISDYRLEP